MILITNSFKKYEDEHFINKDNRKMKTLNEYLINYVGIVESMMRENQLSQILQKIEKWNTVENWMKYEKKNGGDIDEIDEDYFYTEMVLCDRCVRTLNRYLDYDIDEISTNGKINLEILSDKLTQELAEDYSNGDLDDLNEYFGDWEDYITIFEIAWGMVTKQPFFIEL